jgi:succinate dehydrogenase hydrophobic anchor subunit
MHYKVVSFITQQATAIIDISLIGLLSVVMAPQRSNMSKITQNILSNIINLILLRLECS